MLNRVLDCCYHEYKIYKLCIVNLKGFSGLIYFKLHQQLLLIVITIIFVEVFTIK